MILKSEGLEEQQTYSAQNLTSRKVRRKGPFEQSYSLKESYASLI